MATVTIYYPDITGALKDAGNAEGELNEYTLDIQKYAVNALGNLSGSDDSGYIGSAISLAKGKIKKNDTNQKALKTLNRTLDNLKELAIDTDKEVADAITKVADRQLDTKKNWFSVGAEVIYSFFVKATGKISEFPWLKKAVDKIRAAKSAYKKIKDKVVWFFNTGAGVYYKTMLETAQDILGTVSLVGAAIVATMTIPFIGGPLAVVATVTIGAVYLIHKFNNANIAVTNAQHSIDLYNEATNGSKTDYSKLAVAQYYGGIKDIESYTKKMDFGNQGDNIYTEGIGEGVQRVGGGLENVLKFLELAGGIGKMGLVYKGDTPVGYDFSKENVLKNLKKQIIEDMEKSGINIIEEKKGNQVTKKVSLDLTTMFLGDALPDSTDIPSYISGKISAGIANWTTMDSKSTYSYENTASYLVAQDGRDIWDGFEKFNPTEFIFKRGDLVKDISKLSDSIYNNINSHMPEPSEAETFLDYLLYKAN